MLKGRCHCGQVSYESAAEPLRSALCHCTDCRRSAGAPSVAWAFFPTDALKIDGATSSYASSEHVLRHFCPHCGSGLFYTNEALIPGITNVRIATLDDPNVVAPKAQVQVAERIAWMEQLDEIPEFERYSG